MDKRFIFTAYVAVAGFLHADIDEDYNTDYQDVEQTTDFDNSYSSSSPSGSYYQEYRAEQRNYPNQDRNFSNQDRNYSNQDSNDQRNDQFTTPDDQRIVKKIRDAMSGWFHRDNKTFISVNNGNVVVRGSVESVADKEDIEKKIRNLDGVRSFNSQLFVRDTRDSDAISSKYPQDRAQTNSDQQLNKKIREAISEGWFTDSNKTLVVQTANGFVVVRGTVDNVKEQQKILDKIKQIEGVRGVSSNLQVKNTQY